MICFRRLVKLLLFFTSFSIVLKLDAQVHNSPTYVLGQKTVNLLQSNSEKVDSVPVPAIIDKDQLASLSRTENLQFSLPLKILKVNCSYGWRVHPVTHLSDFHRGVDLAARSATVYSVLSGYVTEVGYNPILGNYIRVNHHIIQSIYGHLSLILVHKGDAVNAGNAIGITGATGRVTGEHLHFSIKIQNTYTNPLLFIKLLMEIASQDP